MKQPANRALTLLRRFIDRAGAFLIIAAVVLFIIVSSWQHGSSPQAERFADGVQRVIGGVLGDVGSSL